MVMPALVGKLLTFKLYTMLEVSNLWMTYTKLYYSFNELLAGYPILSDYTYKAIVIAKT